MLDGRAAVEAYRVRSEIIPRPWPKQQDLVDAIHENVAGIVRALAARAAQAWTAVAPAAKALGDLDVTIGPRDHLLRSGTDKQIKSFRVIQDEAEVFQRLRDAWGELPHPRPSWTGRAATP